MKSSGLGLEFNIKISRASRELFCKSHNNVVVHTASHGGIPGATKMDEFQQLEITYKNELLGEACK